MNDNFTAFESDALWMHWTNGDYNEMREFVNNLIDIKLDELEDRIVKDFEQRYELMDY